MALSEGLDDLMEVYKQDGSRLKKSEQCITFSRIMDCCSHDSFAVALVPLGSSRRSYLSHNLVREEPYNYANGSFSRGSSNGFPIKSER